MRRRFADDRPAPGWNPLTLALLAGAWIAALPNWPLWRALLTLPETGASPRGLLFATREARITIGLATGTAAAADFYYYRLPHVGATAWAALAALDFNPFVAGGRR